MPKLVCHFSFEKLFRNQIDCEVEMVFAPHLRWPTLSERFSITLTAGPPAKWRFGWIGPEEGKDNEVKAPKEVRIGAAVRTNLSSVYLVDAHKNRVTDRRWTDAARPMLVLEYSDATGALVEMPVPLKFRSDGQGARWVVGNSASWHGDPNYACRVTVKNDETDVDGSMAADTEDEVTKVLSELAPLEKKLKLLPGQPAHLVLRYATF